MISTIVFVAFMAFLIKINPPENRFWLYWFSIMCVLAQCGYKVGFIGLVVWLLIVRVVCDLCAAGKQG